MLWLNFGMLIVTAASAGISYLLFRTQVEPEVVVFVEVDGSGDLTLVIANIGKGVAKGVTFASSEPLPAGVRPSQQFIDSGPLVHGIPALGPGARRVVLWGLADTLMGVLDRRVIRIVATYESDNHGPWTGRQLITESLIEVGSFIGTVLPRNHAARAAESLDQMARTANEALRSGRIPRAGSSSLSG